MCVREVDLLGNSVRARGFAIRNIANCRPIGEAICPPKHVQRWVKMANWFKNGDQSGVRGVFGWCERCFWLKNVHPC